MPDLVKILLRSGPCWDSPAWLRLCLAWPRNPLTRFLLLAALLPLAACAGRGRAAGDNGAVYKHLADRLSDGHGKLAIRKVAVLPFSYVDRHPSPDGAVIAEKLITRITNEGDLEVVERSLLAKVLDELRLQHSGIVDETSIKGLGKILGVEAVVTGTLTKQKNGALEINARLIKTETAAILAVAAGNVYPDWETTRETRPAIAVLLPPKPEPAAPRTEPTAESPVDNSPIAVVNGAARWWPADGTAVEKITGTRGVMVNGAVFRNGASREAFSFDGKDDYVSAARGVYYDALLDGHHPFSFSFYINRSGTDTIQGVFAKGADPLITALYVNKSQYSYALTLVIKHNHQQCLSATAHGAWPAAGEWEHWAATYDGSGRAAGIRIYRKGIPLDMTVYMDSLGDTTAANDSPLEFGRIGGDLNWHFSGGLDEIKLFSRALSDREVATLASKKYASVN